MKEWMEIGVTDVRNLNFFIRNGNFIKTYKKVLVKTTVLINFLFFPTVN